MVRYELKKQRKATKSAENGNGQGIIEKAVISVDKEEHKRRNVLMPVELTELEFNVLLGLMEGRSYYEIQVGVKLINPKDSYGRVIERLKKKFDAFTPSHVVYKAIKMGLV